MKPVSSALTAVIGGGILAYTLGCRDTVEDIQTTIDCFTYCDRADECNSIDEGECRSSCERQLDQCEPELRDEVQDLLDECGEVDSCGEFALCRVEASTRCTFDLSQ